MADWTAIDDPIERLHGFVSGFHATHYVYIGVESGLFEALVDPRTPGDVASQLDLHEPYVRRFCEIGLRWGLLTLAADSRASDTGDETEKGEAIDDAVAVRLPAGSPGVHPVHGRSLRVRGRPPERGLRRLSGLLPERRN